MSESTPSPAAPNATSLPRRYEIDALRSIALVLLIFYHAFCAFQPFGPLVGFITYPQTLQTAWFLGEALNPWRIPVLFLITGITTGYLLQNRSVGALLEARLSRLVPALVFTSLFIAPLSSALMQIHYQSKVTYVPSPGHLWFVSNLVVYFVLAAPLLLALKRTANSAIFLKLRALPSYLWLGVLPTWLFLVSWFLEPHVGPESFSTHVMRFFYGFASFLAGAVLVSFGDRFWKGIREVAVPALVAVIALYFMRLNGAFPSNPFGAMALRTLESASGMLAFLGIGSLFLAKPSKLFSWLNRGVFAIYIIHMPVQQLMALLLFPTEWNPWLILALQSVGTLGLSAAIYHFALLRIRWLHPLFGIAPPKRVPKAEAPEGTSTRPWVAITSRVACVYVVPTLLVGVTVAILVSTAQSGPRRPATAVSDIGVENMAVEISDSGQNMAAARFRNQISRRTPEENRVKSAAVEDALKAAVEQENPIRVDLLELELRLIKEALEDQ